MRLAQLHCRIETCGMTMKDGAAGGDRTHFLKIKGLGCVECYWWIRIVKQFRLPYARVLPYRSEGEPGIKKTRRKRAS